MLWLTAISIQIKAAKETRLVMHCHVMNEKLPSQVSEFSAENCSYAWEPCKSALQNSTQTFIILWPVHPIHTTSLYTQNMADHSVVARYESNESDPSWALMFCFDNALLESLASLSIWSLCFALPTRFCVPECHHNRVESSTAEKVFLFSVFSFASEGKLLCGSKRGETSKLNTQFIAHVQARVHPGMFP